MAGQRAVVYLRVSSETQRDNTSLATQEAECRSLCAARGYDVLEVVTDVETGVESYAWRPGLQRVRDLLRRGAANALVCWKFDRANRDSVDNLLLYRLGESTGALLTSVHDGDVTYDSAGRMKMFLLGESGRIERDNIVLRNWTGLERRIADGLPLIGGKPLYGLRYTYGPGRRHEQKRKLSYEPDPETAPIVRTCFEKIASGYSLTRLARELNEQGVPTPSQILSRRGLLKPGAHVATHWSRQVLHQIVSNPAYAGRHVTRKRKTVELPPEHEGAKPNLVLRRRPEGDPKSAVILIPPIVSEELFASVQAIMRVHKEEAARHNPQPESTLLRAGHAYCGLCGERLVVAAHTDGSRVYMCRNRQGTDNKRCTGGAFGIRANVVDPDVWEKVCKIARDTGKLARLLERRHQQEMQVLEDIQREGAIVAAELAEAEREKALIERRMATETDDTIYAGLREQYKRVARTLAELGKRRKHESMQVGKYTLILVSIKDLMTRLAEANPTPTAQRWADLQDPLANLTYSEKRELLRLLNVKVFMYPTDSEYARTHDKRWEVTFDPDSAHSASNLW